MSTGLIIGAVVLVVIVIVVVSLHFAGVFGESSDGSKNDSTAPSDAPSNVPKQQQQPPPETQSETPPSPPPEQPPAEQQDSPPPDQDEPSQQQELSADLAGMIALNDDTANLPELIMRQRCAEAIDGKLLDSADASSKFLATFPFCPALTKAASGSSVEGAPCRMDACGKCGSTCPPELCGVASRTLPLGCRMPRDWAPGDAQPLACRFARVETRNEEAARALFGQGCPPRQ